MKEDLPPSRLAERYIVRFPDGMRNKIFNVAKTNNRTANAEIIARLESTFQNSQHAKDSLAPELITAQVQLDMADLAIQNMAIRAKLKEAGELMLQLASSLDKLKPDDVPALLEDLKNLGSEALVLGSSETSPQNTAFEQWREASQRKKEIVESLILRNKKASDF